MRPWASVVVVSCACAAPSMADVLNMPSGLISLETVTVGNPGNAGELSGAGAGGYGPDRICGAVNYVYHIGKFEITAAQYTEFLNAVAATDSLGLYNSSMVSSSSGCQIQRSGSLGTYTYSVSADWANRPVNLVSWGDAARFCNWLENGRPVGPLGPATTEDGSYHLNWAVSNEALLAVTRKAGARWVIPSEDEWYKAAYHKNDGITGNYWDYPTSTDNHPSHVLTNPDPGNNANYNTGTYSSPDYTVGGPFYRTPVGEFESSESPYGTFDQGGNVWEWTEAVQSVVYRGLRGGSYRDFDYALEASDRGVGAPTVELYSAGFRVTLVPEPVTFVVLAFGGLALLRSRR